MSTKVKKHPPLGDRVGWGEEKIDLHQASLEISPSNTKENKTMTVVLTALVLSSWCYDEKKWCSLKNAISQSIFNPTRAACKLSAVETLYYKPGMSHSCGHIHNQFEFDRECVPCMTSHPQSLAIDPKSEETVNF